MGIENNSNSDVSSSLNKRDNILNPFIIFHDLRKNNPFKIIIGYINTNSIRCKLDALKKLVLNNIDVVMISEAKTDDSFPIT